MFILIRRDFDVSKARSIFLDICFLKRSAKDDNNVRSLLTNQSSVSEEKSEWREEEKNKQNADDEVRIKIREGKKFFQVSTLNLNKTPLD
jgi:hypothetical protein